MVSELFTKRHVMRTSAKTVLYLSVLSMIMSCSGLSSSSSEGTPEIIDSIPIRVIDNNVNAVEVWNLGTVPAGKVVKKGIAICNFDSVRGARIVRIDGDNLVSKCNPSLDSIEPKMLIGVDFKLKVPEEKGPFDATMKIHCNNVKNPSIIKLHGNSE